MKKYFFRGPFFPTKTFLKQTGNLSASRNYFFKKKPPNLNFLLKKRYEWMKEYCKNKEFIVEIGSGAGLIKEFIPNAKIECTDVEKHPWLDKQVDALDPPYPDKSIDVLIVNEVIHHLESPIKFFKQAYRILKKDGYLLINDVHTSLIMRFLLRSLSHEGYSYDINIFDENEKTCIGTDPWTANNAVTEILMKDKKLFQEKTNFTVLQYHKVEFLIFLVSGGVVTKTPTIQLPEIILRIIHRIDQCLIRIFPNIFALSSKIVLKK